MILTSILLPTAAANFSNVESLMSSAWFSILEMLDFFVLIFEAISSWVSPALTRASLSSTPILKSSYPLSKSLANSGLFFKSVIRLSSVFNSILLHISHELSRESYIFVLFLVILFLRPTEGDYDSTIKFKEVDSKRIATKCNSEFPKIWVTNDLLEVGFLECETIFKNLKSPDDLQLLLWGKALHEVLDWPLS